MSELKAKYLDRVVCIRNGSTDDGEYGLVTHVAENEHVTLTVTFYVMFGVRHQNWYSLEDVELTDKDWKENLPCDPQVRCVLDKRYTGLWFIVDSKGRNATGYGTPGIAWAHWLREHDDEATLALHTLIKEVQNGTPAQKLANQQGDDAERDGAENARLDRDSSKVGTGIDPSK